MCIYIYIRLVICHCISCLCFVVLFLYCYLIFCTDMQTASISPFMWTVTIKANLILSCKLNMFDETF